MYWTRWNFEGKKTKRKPLLSCRWHVADLNDFVLSELILMDKKDINNDVSKYPWLDGVWLGTSNST